jgi:hypothetical protein
MCKEVGAKKTRYYCGKECQGRQLQVHFYSRVIQAVLVIF